jgi:AcrR family transcriptional regulator
MNTSSPTGAEPTPKRRRTRERLVKTAIALFETHGFEDTTVAQIAAAAGVSEMTFFRNFATKEAVLLDDPYDPFIAEHIMAQPNEWGALRRSVEGLRSAWQTLPEPEEEQTRRRIRIVASSGALRAASWRNNEATQHIIAEALIHSGTSRLQARVAAAACIAAITAALMAWANDETRTLGEQINDALNVLTAGNS